jgi:hypothetical protein
MSIRIQHEALPGTNVSEVSRGEEVSRSAKNGAPPASATAERGGDQVEISSLSGSITETLSAAAAHQADRIRLLSALYASGRYTVDSATVSRALVSKALGGSVEKCEP